MKRALVLGLGKSGTSAKALLARDGCSAEGVEGFDFVVASPGLRVVSELQVGCEALRRQGVKLLAVTGSKGKSSVVKLVADGINGAGGRAVACGNYGVPVCDVALGGQAHGATWAVVEVSSFQLETTHLPSDAFEGAAVLNLQEDHLDRHGSVEVYHGLKLALLRMAKVGMGPECLAKLATMEKTRELMGGSYFDNDILRANGAAGVALMRIAGLNDAQIAQAFRDFVPLPHRMQEVGIVEGVRYVDDSKATSIAALVAGVVMAARGKNIRLIAGGLAKGDDFGAALPHLTERVKKVYLIGRCAEQFFKAWSASVDCEICQTLDRAVDAAKREAANGETVLLSPGTASFDQFKSFGERGEVFVQLVKKERQKK